MKKKLVFMLAMIFALMMVLTIGINATTIYQTSDGTELFRYEVYADSADVISVRGAKNDDFIGTIKSYSGSFPKVDETGNALTWYVTETKTDENGNTIKVVNSFVTDDTAWCTISSAGNYKYNTEKGVHYRNVVSVNFPNDKNIQRVQNGTNTFGLYANSGYFAPASSELLFVYFPNTYVGHPNTLDRMVQATPVLEVYFDSKIELNYFSDTAFYSCRNLRSIVIPRSIETFDCSNGTFFQCINLTDVTFEEGSRLTYIGKQAFKNCESLTEIKLPNTVTTIGERVFESCERLEKVSFGASLENLTQSLIYQTYNLSYIYLPKTISSAVGTHALSSSDGSYRKSVIFFNGTYEEALNLKALVIANGTSHNHKINHENFIQWDPNVTDEEYVKKANDEGKNYVVYGYNTCEAFYGGEHANGTVYSFPDLHSFGTCTVGCTRNCGESTTTTISPVFVNIGYSHSETNVYAVMQGFAINRDSLEIYNTWASENGHGVIDSYGVVAASVNGLDGANEVFGEDGQVLDGIKVASASFSDKDYVIFEMKISGLTPDKMLGDISYADVEIYNCGYYILKTTDENGTTYASYYMDVNGTTEVLTYTTTYNKELQKG